MKNFLKSLTVILFSALAIGQNLPNISTQTKGQLPTSRLFAPGVNGLCLQTDGNGNVVVAGCAPASSGTVTSFSAIGISPLFSTSVATPNTTPSLSFSLSPFAAHTFYGNNTSGTAVPGAQSIGLSDLPGSGSATINTSGPLGGGGSLVLGASLTLTCASCVTSIPQQPITKTAIASNWINSYDSTTGLFTATRPAYTDLTGLPQLAVTKTSVASNWLNSYSSVTGLFTATQPASSDLSDFPSQVGNSGKFLSTNGTVLSFASGNSGTVTSFSSGNLSPLFTTSVANPTTTPSQTFSLSNAGAHLFFGNNTGATAAPAYESIGNGDLPGSGSITLNTIAPITGGGSVALGSSLTFACASCLTSVTAHNLLSATHGDTTTHSVVRGDLIAGIGAVPTWTAVAKGGTNTYPKWNASGDVIASTNPASGTGSPTSCTNQAVTAFTLNADAAPTSTCTTITSSFTSGTFPASAHNLLSATHGDTTPGSVVTGDIISGQSSAWARLGGNTSTTPQYLKSLGSGAAATAPSWAQVAYTDLSGVPSTFSPTAHNILSAQHGDTTVASAVRGDGFFAIGATPTWQRLAHPSTSGGYFKWNGTDIVASTGAASGTGACAANQYANTLNADAAPACSQVAYSQVSGTPTIQYQTVQDEAVSLAQRATINFIGSGVTCADNAGSSRTDCTIPGAGAGPIGTDKQIAYNNAGTESGSANLTWDNTNAVLNVGQATALTNNPLALGGNVNDFLQANIQNKSAGNAASSDWVATSDQGSNTVGFIDLGINSSTYNQAGLNIVGVNDGYLYVMGGAAAGGGNLALGTASAGQVVKFHTGGTTSSNLRMTIADTAITGAAGVTATWDTLKAKYWGAAPVFDATQYSGADMCAKILAVYSDSAYLAAANAIVDARGFSGSQNCASNMLATTRPTWVKIGAVTIHATVNQAAGFPTASVLSAPAAPTTNTNTTTGGTLSNAVFVKVGYVTAWMPDAINTLGPSAELTASMNAACSGTPTCTETINSPAAVVGAYAYNVYESNTTGNEKLCNVAPIPLGTNYKITANCSGVAINTANLAFIDRSLLSGIGDNSKISLENTAASIDASGTWNWDFNDLSIVSTLTTQSVNGMLQMGNAIRVSNITFSGGGTHVYIAGSMDTVKRTRHYGFTVSAGPVTAITAFAAKWLRIEDTVMSNFTFPVSATLNNGISVNQCTMCVVDGVRSENVDNSTAVNGGSMLVATGDGTAANSSSHVVFTNFQCENLINVNCADFLNFTHDSEMSNATCRNTNNTAGVGSNILGADCFDIFMAGHINLTNMIGNHRGGAGGACCPTLEAYSVSDMNVNSSNFSDDQGNEGVRIVGSPAVNFNGVITSRNLNSGIVLADLASVVTCNGTTTVVWVSGQPFGPWQPGTQVWIGPTPTAFNISSVTDFHTMVLTTTCSLGASQALSVYTQDTTITGLKADDNGQAGTGTGVRTGLAEGVYVSGHSQVTITGGSANDNAPVLANKHQQYAVRMENSARSVINMMDGSGNGGGSNCGLAVKPMGATTEWFCDSSKLSPILAHDGSTNKIVALTPMIYNYGGNEQAQAATTSDSSAINTTETVIVKTLAMPVSRLVAGTHIRAVLTGTCTSTAANVSTFTIRMGTNGTTADSSIAAPATAVAATSGTNIPFRVTIDFTIRTVGASGTGFITLDLENQGTTGIATTALQLIQPSMSTFNTTTANNILSITYKSAASTTTSTFKQGVMQFVNQ